MNIWGVFKVECISDDGAYGETLIVCFEQEQDAINYKESKFPNKDYGGDDAYLIVKPVTFVRSGEYDTTNNYGLANDYINPSYKCSCGHATVVPYENFNVIKEEIKENGITVGVREAWTFVCERCHESQSAFENVMMFDSEDENYRWRLASLGYNLEQYIHDTSFRVRRVVAANGLGHEEFVTNPNEHPVVLREIVNQGKYLDVLVNHPDKDVSTLAKEKLRQMNAVIGTPS